MTLDIKSFKIKPYSSLLDNLLMNKDNIRLLNFQNDSALSNLLETVGLLSEFLRLLNEIENSLHSNRRMILSINLEKIPIKISLGDFATLKEEFKVCMDILENENWEFIYNSFQLLMITYLVYKEKTSENFELIINQITNFLPKLNLNLMKFLKINDYSFIDQTINDYLENSLDIKDRKPIVNFGWILFFEIENNKKEFDAENHQLMNFYDNKSQNHSVSMKLGQSISLKIKILNNSTLKIKFKSLELVFIDQLTNEYINYDTKINEGHINPGNSEFNFNFSNENYNDEKIIKLEKVNIYLYNGLICEIKFDEQKSKKFIIKISKMDFKINFFISQLENEKFYSDVLYDFYYYFYNYNNQNTLRFEFLDTNNCLILSKSAEILDFYQENELMSEDKINEILISLKEDINFDFSGKIIRNKKITELLEIDHNSVTLRNTDEKVFNQRFLMRINFRLHESDYQSHPLVIKIKTISNNSEVLLLNENLFLETQKLFITRHCLRKIENNYLLETILDLVVDTNLTEEYLITAPNNEKYLMKKDAQNLKFYQILSENFSLNDSELLGFDFQTKSKKYRYHFDENKILEQLKILESNELSLKISIFSIKLLLN